MLLNTKTPAVQKAIKYSILLLKFRPHSEKELTERLTKKSFNDKVIAQAMDFLKKNLLVNDRLFAREWIEFRIKKLIAVKKIILELEAKGIDRQIIEEEIQQILSGYNEEKAVYITVKQQLNKLNNLDPQKAKARVYGYLLRRGFHPETITDTLEELIM